MAIVTTDNQHYSDIADAIRAKLKTETTFRPGGMASAILAIPTGGEMPKVVGGLEIAPEYAIAAIVDNTMPDVITALGWVSIGEIVEFSAAATVSGGLPGTIGINANLEVE